MLKFKAKVNFDEEIKRLANESQRIANENLMERVKFATEALTRVTPIDTGYARSRWNYSFDKDSNGNITGTIDNDAPYIENLNRGSSKQAPAYFIEQTLFAIGELQFPVVETK
jgi:hypothetical protein